MSASLELTKDLAHAMLMTDLMASRLADFYRQGSLENDAKLAMADELIFALEQKTAELLKTLDAAQSTVLESGLR